MPCPQRPFQVLIFFQADSVPFTAWVIQVGRSLWLWAISCPSPFIRDSKWSGGVRAGHGSQVLIHLIPGAVAYTLYHFLGLDSSQS